MLIYDIKKSKKGVTVIGRTTAFEVWRAVINKKRASKLTFNSSLCRVAASPH